MNLNDLKLLKSPMHCRKATANTYPYKENYNVIYERTISRPRSTLTGGAFDIASHLPALVDVTPSNTCWLYSFKQATDNSSFSLRSTNGRYNIIEPCIRFSAAKLHSQSWCSASKPLFNTVFSASSLEIGPSVTDIFFWNKLMNLIFTSLWESFLLFNQGSSANEITIYLRFQLGLL